MTNQSTTGMNLTAIPTEAISRNIAFLSQVMMGKLQQNASLLIAALSTLSVNETSLSMSSARSSARDNLAGSIAEGIGAGAGGLSQIIGAGAIGNEMRIQGNANKEYEMALNDSHGGDDFEKVAASAKETPEKALETKENTIKKSDLRVKQIEGYTNMGNTVAQALGKVVGAGFTSSAQLENADQKLAEQVASALMNTLNTIVSQVTQDFSSNNPYGQLVNLAN